MDLCRLMVYFDAQLLCLNRMALQELIFSNLKLRWSRHQRIELGMLWRACYAKIEMGLGEGMNITFSFSNIEAGKLVKSPYIIAVNLPQKV